MKRFLSAVLIVCLLFVSSVAYALPKSAALQAMDSFAGVLDRAYVVGDETALFKYVRFLDVNGDGVEEMLAICTSDKQGAAAACYLFSYTEGNGIDDYALFSRIYFNDFIALLGDIDLFVDSGKCVFRDSTHAVGSSSGFDSPGYVRYNDFSIADNGKIISGTYGSYIAEGGYMGESEDTYEEATPENEKNAIVAKWEKGSKIHIMTLGEPDAYGCPKLILGNEYMSREEAKEYLRGKRDNVIKESYSGFSEITSSCSDEDRTEISKLLSNFYVREQTVYALLSEDELIELAYEILADTTLEDYIYPVDTFSVNAGGCLEVYNTDDVEDLIYSLTGCKVNYRTHTCLEEHCSIRDQQLHTWEAVGQDVLGKVESRDLVVIHTSEMGEYPKAVIKNIFEISPDRLLVVYEYTFYDPVYTYAVVGKRIYDGNNEFYMVEQGGKNIADFGYLNKYVETSREPSNISIDYSCVKGYSEPEQYVDYLRTVIAGVMPNDSAAEDIVRFVEYSIANACAPVIEVKNKTVVVGADNILSELEKAEKLRADSEKVLAENGIKLNKPIEIALRLDTNGANLKRGITVEFNNSLEGLSERFDSITVVCDEKMQSVGLNSAELKKMSGVRIMLKSRNEKYTVCLIDADGKKIEESEAKFTLFFESCSEYNTVFYEKDGKKQIWGGINDTANNLIKFMTSYSGNYYVEENIPEISDIDALSDEEKEAVRYMVSKGYFNLEDGRFNPYGSLSRYDFTKILVGIFYAMDYNAECGFADVAKDNPYYGYVASSQSEEIVKGYEDNTFKGNKNATNEEVISVASRTLANKKEYLYPENTSEYIQFVDNEEITGWENQYGEIALAVREGLIDKGGVLAPRANISRVDAAVILYRLYKLLYGVSPAEINTNTTSGSESGLVPIAVAGSVGVVAAGGAALLIWRRKRINALSGATTPDDN